MPRKRSKQKRTTPQRRTMQRNRAKALPQAGAQQASAAQVRTSITLTVVEPVDSSSVGEQFGVLGTCDSAGAVVTVELVDAAGVTVATQTDTVDADETWSVGFSGVAPGSYTVQVSIPGLAASAIGITVTDFAITTPQVNGDVATGCTVVGTCEALASDPGLTVTVTYTDGTTTVEQEALTNPSAQTWEAYFPSLPEGSGSFTAECSDGQSDTAAGQTVTDVGEIQNPVEGEVIDTSAPAPRTAVAKLLKGRIVPATNQVWVCASRRGKRIRVIKPTVKPNGKWEINVKKLFRGAVQLGEFHFQVLIR